MKVCISIIAAVGAAAGGAAGMAWAAGSSDTVKIAVEGRIAPKCDLDEKGDTATRTINLGDVKKGGQYQFVFGIDCNAPFKYALESANGAMVLQPPPASVSASFTDRVPYTVAVNIPTDDVVISDRCASETIKSGNVTCPLHDSRNGIAIDGHATLTVEWSAPSKPTLVGNFADQLIFKVGVRQ